MSAEEQWIVLLAPEVAGMTATPVGLFASREDGLEYVDRLPTVQGLRAHVLRLQPPRERSS